MWNYLLCYSTCYRGSSRASYKFVRGGSKDCCLNRLDFGTNCSRSGAYLNSDSQHVALEFTESQELTKSWIEVFGHWENRVWVSGLRVLVEV